MGVCVCGGVGGLNSCQMKLRDGDVVGEGGGGAEVDKLELV